MTLMITGDNIRIVRTKDSTCDKSAAEWLSDKARRQPRNADGRWRATAPQATKHKAQAFRRFFVLARPID